jgi:hypothetical protein
VGIAKAPMPALKNWNNDVLGNIDGVLTVINDAVIR